MISHLSNSINGGMVSSLSSAAPGATQPQVQTAKAADASQVNISAQAQQMFEFEQSLNFAHLSQADEDRVNEINKEIDQILGVDQIKFSKADEKTAEQLYKQIDSLFSDNQITASEEKTLFELDNKLASLYQKYEKPLSAEQEQKLEGLLSELDSIYGTGDPVQFNDPLDGLYQDLALTPEAQKQADKINAEIDRVLGLDQMQFSEQDLDAADAVYQQMDEIFADGKVSKNEGDSLAKLDEQLVNIFQKYEKPLSKEDEQKLDGLFGQLDKLYGLS